MRPVLKPAVRRIWRDKTTLQFGIDPETTIVLGGVDQATARFVEALDGTKETQEAIKAAAELGIEEPRAAKVLDLLTSGGLLDDASADTHVLYEMSAEERERLRPDLAALSLVNRAPGGGITALTRRRESGVHILGAGRVGATLAHLLAAAGVGHIVVSDPETVRFEDVAPGGLTPSDVGLRRQDAVKAGLRRLWKDTKLTLPSGRSTPDLAVLVSTSRVDPEAADKFMRSGVPHLAVGIREVTGVIGPLVVPGHTSCLRCHELYRRDKDPVWPRIVAQLATGDAWTVRPCDTTLAVTVAAQAALEVLMFLEEGKSGAFDGTLEIRLPDGLLRRRSWQAHYACGCGWAMEELE
jgi:hypothetical protein